jgi:hypothetical protein
MSGVTPFLETDSSIIGNQEASETVFISKFGVVGAFSAPFTFPFLEGILYIAISDGVLLALAS